MHTVTILDLQVGGNTLLGMLEEMAFERFDPR